MTYIKYNDIVNKIQYPLERRMQMKKKILCILMGGLMMISIATNAFAGTNRVTGTYLSLQVGSTSTSGYSQVDDRFGKSRCVQTWASAYNSAGTKIAYDYIQLNQTASVRFSKLVNVHHVDGTGKIFEGSTPSTRLLETRSIRANS